MVYDESRKNLQTLWNENQIRSPAGRISEQSFE
jgi:hypothetical protein